MTRVLPPFVLASGVSYARDDRRDRESFGALAAGKTSALGELYDRHAASLFRHACSLTRRRADAEDLVHAVFVKVASMGADLLGVRHPASYLHRILHTTWLDGHRRSIVGERVVEEAASATGEATWFGADDAIDIARALAVLPIEQREVIVLHVVEGFSFREIGALTGVSMFTAAARYRLAIAKLKQTLDPAAGDA